MDEHYDPLLRLGHFVVSLTSDYQPKPYINRLPPTNRLCRLVWNLVWVTLARTSPTFAFGWRRFLLQLFGARLAKSARVYPRARVWAPWNLTMADYSCLADDVECYSVDQIIIESFVTVSQGSRLCTASHDFTDTDFRLITSPVTIHSKAWVAAYAYIGPGVVVGEGAVVGATASVYKNVPPWTVVGGNPARYLRSRIVSDSRHSASDTASVPYTS